MRSGSSRARRRAVAVTVVAAVAVVGLLTPSCSDPDDLVVVAASSLRTVLPTVADEVGPPDATFSFVGSQAAVAQVQAGAPVDVVITAGWPPMQLLVDAGAVEEPRVLAGGQLAVVVPSGNPSGVRRLEDLADPALTVVLAGPDVPAGRLARTAFEQAGVHVDPAASERSAAAVVTRVATGEADAGIAYRTDGAVPGVEVVDVTALPSVVYVGAVVSGAPDEAEEWLEDMSSPIAAQALVASGLEEPG